MDMSWSHVYVTYPLSMRIGFLITFVYSAWCVMTLVRRRSSQPGVLAVIPLLVSLPGVFLAFARVAEGMARSGAGPVALSAGLAEALHSLFIGAVVSALLALVGAVRGPRESSLRATVATVLFMAIPAAVTIWFAADLGSVRWFAQPQVQRSLGGSIVTAVASIAFLAIAFRRRLQPSVIAVGVTAVAIAVVVWQRIEMYRRVAMGL